MNQYLIEQGFADEAEESALSKVRTDPGLPGWQFYVNQYLIEQGFADEAEESALSKVRI